MVGNESFWEGLALPAPPGQQVGNEALWEGQALPVNILPVCQGLG